MSFISTSLRTRIGLRLDNLDDHDQAATMARRQTNQKPRTAAPAKKAAPENASHRNPKSMVIRIGAGEVGSSVSQLVLDVRRVMEPQTAIRLKERRANRLKDYVVMAGPLGVTHLLLFTRSPSGNTNLRIALTPRGPTLHFHVDKYSLAKDVQKAQRHPRGIGKEHTTPPLVRPRLPLHCFAVLADDTSASWS